MEGKQIPRFARDDRDVVPLHADRLTSAALRTPYSERRIPNAAFRTPHPELRTQMTDVISGTLDMLILKSLSLEPMHGFGITKRIEQISKGVFKVNPGSLLLAFQRLERDAMIDAEWRATENNRRAKYYRLTDKGRKQLKTETREWERRVAAIARLMEA